MPSGIIIKGIGGFYYVKSEDTVYECKARGIFRKNEQTPLPGDFVRISISDPNKKIGNIEEILPRKNFLVRPAVANVEQVAAVISVKSPVPDFALLDKLLIVAGLKGIEVLFCINKIDLDPDGNYNRMLDAYTGAGYTCIPLSSKAGTGFEVLRGALKNKVSVLAGQSGVGKSTLLNHIMNAWVMQTGEVSGKIGRGRHTTRHAELLELSGGGYILDTPGFSSFELSGLECEELENFYPEFEGCLGMCKFTGCSHISEPGCAVKSRLDDGLIDTDRYNRYVGFYQALQDLKKNKYKK